MITPRLPVIARDCLKLTERQTVVSMLYPYA
jgi:hypothetical protein